MERHSQDFMLRLKDALAASWDRQTAYFEAEQLGNPALGQCYPTSKVVQHYYAKTEILKGNVWTGEALETHFWNGLLIGEDWYHIDLTWQQFAAGSIVQEFKVVKREELNDSEATILRCTLLLERVRGYLKNHSDDIL